MDTIFALSTGRGKAGVAVIRVSGPKALSVAEAICGPLKFPRRASLRVLRNPENGDVLDEGIVIYFPAGQSFTGENIVEFQIHGSIAAQDIVLGVLGGFPNCRLANPGEFTQRAMEAGRIDLAQVEGLADLIDAETEAQRRQALKVMRGDLGERVAVWRTKLVRALALLEATIDFSDEDLPPELAAEVLELVGDVTVQIGEQLAGSGAAERIRDGFEVAIVGAPNVGKSTLLNAIAGRDAAITSAIAGTTRDIIEVRADLGGLPVTFLDTAGLRASDEEVEAIGVARAISRSALADLRVFLLDLDNSRAWDREMEKPEDLIVLAKSDLRGAADHGVSGKTGQGVTELLADVRAVLEPRAVGATSVIRARQKLALTTAKQSFESALGLFNNRDLPSELISDELIHGIRSLDALVGRVDVEDLLDEIFSSFCIGK